MSLATLGQRSGTAPTFESLAQSVDALLKQVQRTKATADELENQIDYRKFQRLQKSQHDNKTKYEQFTRTLADLRRGDPNEQEPGRRFEPEITSSLDTIQRTIHGLDAQVAPIAVHQEEMEVQAKAAREEQARIAAVQMQKSKEQEEAEQMAAELDYLQRETGQIVQDMQTINEVTHEVDGLITNQHEVLDHIDQTIVEAVDEMKAGNEELDHAQEDQKSGSKMIIIILIVVITVVVVVAVVLALKFTVFK
jgi:t-SNARE complex subunit (syntaxin)